VTELSLVEASNDDMVIATYTYIILIPKAFMHLGLLIMQCIPIGCNSVPE
jgi:hypothetical protein